MEMEEVIPSCWVKNGGVLWPTQGAARALKACKEPEESWTKFPLIKIKIQSGMCIERKILRSYMDVRQIPTHIYGHLFIFLIHELFKYLCV